MLGDVLGIVDSNGTLVAEYRYDAYGNHVMILDGNGNDVSTNYAHIANVNPIRYRGYYYDIETGFYYLNSRYYDPEIGRFINADGQLNTNNILGFNAFAYCYNNPIQYVDTDGHEPEYFKTREDAIADFAKKYYKGNDDYLSSTEPEYICIVEEVEVECVSECYAMVERQFLWWSWKDVKYSKTTYFTKAYTYTVQKGDINNGTVKFNKSQNVVAMAHTHPNYTFNAYRLAPSTKDYATFSYMDSYYGRPLDYYICMPDGNTWQYTAGIKEHIAIMPETHLMNPAYRKEMS